MYAKVFQQIFDSSLVERPETRFTFMDMLVLADSDGVVDVTHEALARRTNRPLEVIQATITELESPDPRSRTPDDEGRRIVRLDEHRDWGWLIVNYAKFRGLASEEQRKEKTKDRVRRFRERQNIDQCNASVTKSNDKEKEKEKEKKKEKEKNKNKTVPASPVSASPGENTEPVDGNGVDNPPPPPAVVEEVQSAYRKFTDYWNEQWKELHGGDYVWMPADGPAAARIWKSIGPKSMADEKRLNRAYMLVNAYMAETGGYYEGHPLARLSQDIHKFAARAMSGQGDAT